MLAMLGGPRVSQTDGSVEHRSLRGRIAIHAEVPDALELEAIARGRAGQGGFDACTGNDLTGSGIQVGEKVTPGLPRMLGLEEAIIETHLGGHGVDLRYPME